MGKRIPLVPHVSALDGTEKIPCIQGGGDNYVTPADIRDYVADNIALSEVLSNSLHTGPYAIIADYATASKVAVINASKELVSSSVGSAQLAYINNLSSSAQDQIDAIISLTNSLNTIVTNLSGDLAKLPTKPNCRVASLANINLASPPAAVDGKTLADGDRILVKNQAVNTENGIYVKAGSSWGIPSDFSPPYKVAGCIVLVEEGTQEDTLWKCVTDELWTPGLAVEFVEIDALVGAAAPITTPSAAPGNWYGTPGNNIGLADPDAWGSFKRGATTYKIPLYNT